MIPTSTVIDVVSRNPWTALVLSPEGDVAEVVPFSTQPTPQSLLEFAHTHAQGRRFRFVQQARLDPAQLEVLLVETRASSVGNRPVAAPGRALEAFEPRLHPLRPIRAVAEAISAWVARRFL